MTEKDILYAANHWYVTRKNLFAKKTMDIKDWKTLSYAEHLLMDTCKEHDKEKTSS